jgi:hypothetical protein
MGFKLTSGGIEVLDTPESHLAFIRSQWRDFAAFAWEKYIKEGRGGIVVDLRKASKASGNLQVPTFYVANGSERLRKLGGWPNDEIAMAVNDYDPEQDVIFIFLRLNGDVFKYNVSDELTPPEAHRVRSQ